MSRGRDAGVVARSTVDCGCCGGDGEGACGAKDVAAEMMISESVGETMAVFFGGKNGEGGGCPQSFYIHGG